MARFCEEARAAIVVSDENPLREPERWRVRAAARLRVPFWTVDADVIVPAGLLLKEQFAARTIRPRLTPLIPTYLGDAREPDARVAWPPKTRVAGAAPDVTASKD